MGSPIFCTPNHLKSTYFTTVIGGGDWDLNNWLTNLKDKYAINRAISNTLVKADTTFDGDLGVVRDLKAVIIPDSNLDNDAKARVQLSNSPAWNGVKVSGVNALNATTLNLSSTTQSNIQAGEIFHIANDSQLYMATSDLGLGENKFKWSKDMTNAVWLYSLAGTVMNVSSGKLAPDGNYTAVELEWVAGGTGLFRQDSLPSIVNGSTYNYGIYIKIVAITRSSGTETLKMDIGNGASVTLTDDDTPLGVWSPISKDLIAGVNSWADIEAGTNVSYYKIHVWHPKLTTGSGEKEYVSTGAAVAATTGSITIERSGASGTGLAVATVGNEAITCRSGAFFTDNVFDGEWEDYRPVIYDHTDPWGSPKIWIGKETEENRTTANLPNPYIKILPTVKLARYFRISLDNTTNPDGYLYLTDLIVSSGYVPSTGVGLGAVLTPVSNTSSEESAGGVKVFQVEKQGRFLDMKIPDLSVDEALINLYTDFFFIMDDEDTKNMIRTSFLGYFEELGGHQFVDHNWVDTTIRIQEKLG